LTLSRRSSPLLPLVRRELAFVSLAPRNIIQVHRASASSSTMRIRPHSRELAPVISTQSGHHAGAIRGNGAPGADSRRPNRKLPKDRVTERPAAPVAEVAAREDPSSCGPRSRAGLHGDPRSFGERSARSRKARRPARPGIGRLVMACLSPPSRSNLQQAVGHRRRPAPAREDVRDDVPTKRRLAGPRATDTRPPRTTAIP
jgi:hypothetical protein